MAIEHLSLEDYQGNVYTFPDAFWISDDPFSVNIGIVKTFYAAGGRNIADATPNNRTITVSGVLYADSILAFETAMRDMSLALMNGGYLYKSVDSCDRFIEVKLQDISSGPEEGQQLKEISITFAAEYPYWQDDNEETDTNVMAGDGTISVDATGSDYVIRPKIIITADQAVDVPSVKLTQTSDGAMVCVYNDPLFVQDDVVEIDCARGTVTRNGTNSISNFNPARFFRLQPQVNSIDYEGAACTIQIVFRKVYL